MNARISRARPSCRMPIKLSLVPMPRQTQARRAGATRESTTRDTKPDSFLRANPIRRHDTRTFREGSGTDLILALLNKLELSSLLWATMVTDSWDPLYTPSWGFQVHEGHQEMKWVIKTKKRGAHQTCRKTKEEEWTESKGVGFLCNSLTAEEAGEWVTCLTRAQMQKRKSQKNAHRPTQGQQACYRVNCASPFIANSPKTVSAHHYTWRKD